MDRGVVRQILSFYLGSRDVWQAFGCCLLFVALATSCTIVAARGQDATPAEAKQRQDDRDRKAKAALALAGSGDPAKCECAKGKILSWKEAVEKSQRDRVPVVVFADLEPRCCADAIPVKMTAAEAKLIRPERPIVVYIPTASGGLLQATDLPATATMAEVKRAVELAKKQIK